jgi:hypothetical protein
MGIHVYGTCQESTLTASIEINSQLCSISYSTHLNRQTESVFINHLDVVDTTLKEKNCIDIMAIESTHWGLFLDEPSRYKTIDSISPRVLEISNWFYICSVWRASLEHRLDIQLYRSDFYKARAPFGGVVKLVATIIANIYFHSAHSYHMTNITAWQLQWSLLDQM